MGENAVDQSDCNIFKLTLSLEQNDEKAWLFVYWCRFIEIKSWLKNGCGHSGSRTLKLAVSQGGINEVSWFWCVDKNSGNLKVTLIILALSWSEMGVVF